MSRCLQRHCLLIAHIAQQAKPWLCLGHPAGGSLLQGGAQCSKETLERAVQKCECPCEPANELVRTTRLSTHNAQRGSQCTTAQRTAHNEALNAFFRLHSGLCFSYLAFRQPPIQLDPFSLPRYLTPFLIPAPPRNSSCVVLPHTLQEQKIRILLLLSSQRASRLGPRGL